VQHATGGYLLWAKLTMDWTFDLKPQDIFWCTADIGWITGHTYIAYGPLAAGATQVVFEGVPTFPHAGRFWQMIESHKVSIFYTAPTAIRSLIKAADSDEKVHPKNWNLSTLRILGSVGEPINPEAWMWYHRNIGGERCPIVDTFWQTETGGHMITPLPGATPLVPGSCTLPLPGISTAIVDEAGNDMPNGSGGILVVKPGRGLIICPPVSVCHQVSTMGQRSPPMCRWYHIHASGLIGSPTEPSRRRLDRSWRSGHCDPHFMKVRMAVGAVYSWVTP
jgi:acetyl-CoA synthetase